MLAFQRTYGWITWLDYVVPSDVVARLAEMGGTPAVPASQVTAVLAFEVNEVVSVLQASYLAIPHLQSQALNAENVFWVLLWHLSFLLTVSQTSEEWVLASVALVECKSEKSEFLKIVEEPVILLLKPFVFVNAFNFGSLKGFVPNLLLKFLASEDSIMKRPAVGSFDLLIARWAVQEGKTYSDAIPLLLDLGLDALQMENVLAFQLDTVLLAESIHVANATELVSANI